MIRYFRAFAWLRWRTMVHAFRPRGGRDALTRAATIGAVVVPWVLGLLLIPAAIGAGVLGAIGGWMLHEGGRMPAAVLLVGRLILFALIAGVIVGPAIRSIQGSMSSITRFVLLPIPRRALLLSEICAGITDPWILVSLPCIACFCIAIAVSGMIVPAIVATIASVLFLAGLLSLSAAAAFLVQLVFRDRRRGEVLTLVGAVCLAFAGFVPMLLSRAVTHGTPGEHPEVPAAAMVLPSELWARAVRASIEGHAIESALSIVALALFAALLYTAASAAQRRLLDSPAEGSVRRETRRGLPMARRLPGLSEAASAVAWAQMRTVLRTLTGRMAVFLNPFLLLILVVVFPRVSRGIPFGSMSAQRGITLTAVGAAFTLIALGRLLLNQYAADRAGFTLELLLPLSDADIVRGKMAGGALLGAMSFGIFLVFEVPLAGGVAPWALLSIILGAVAAYLLFAPVAALLASLFPKPADLDRLGRASNPHGLASLLGFLAAMTCCAPPAAIFALGRLFALAPPITVVLLVAWLMLAAALSIALRHVAAAALGARRESIAWAAEGR